MHYLIMTSSDDPENCVLKGAPKGMRFPHRPADGVRMEDNYPSEPLDWHMASFAGKKLLDYIGNLSNYPTVSTRFRELLDAHASAEIEYLPVNIIDHKGKKVDGGYYIANIIGTVDCVDLANSEYVSDPMYPDEFQFLSKLNLHLSKIPKESNIFRIKENKTTIIVRSDLAEVIKDSKISGCVFHQLGEHGDFS